MQQINIKPIWSVLCQEASVDANTNNISLFKVVEQLQFGIKMEDLDKLKGDPKFDPTKPIAFPFAMQLVILWKNLSSKSVLEFPVKISLRDPNGNMIDEMSAMVFKFEDGKERLRTIISINRIPVTKSGDYIYSIMIKQNKGDFEEVSSIPVRIDLDLKRESR